MHQVFDITLHTRTNTTSLFFSEIPHTNTNQIEKNLTSDVLKLGCPSAVFPVLK